MMNVSMSKVSSDPLSKIPLRWITKLSITIGTIGLSLGIISHFLSYNNKYLHISLNHAPLFVAEAMSLPPLRREFISQAKNYVFVVASSDRWQSGQAQGRLFQVTEKGRKLLWTRKLPHLYGPRYSLVSNRGQVLLVDEWIHHPIKQTIQLFDRHNFLVVEYSFHRLLKLMDISSSYRQAKTRQNYTAVIAPPLLDADEIKANLEILGRKASLDLRTGSLLVK
jgi:hypothetical protein